jgi:hypothetical protein
VLEVVAAEHVPAPVAGEAHDHLRLLALGDIHRVLPADLAVGNLSRLAPREALAALDTRAFELETELAGIGATLHSLSARLDRMVLLEVEYVQRLREAERKLVQSAADDRRTGRLTWDFQLLRQPTGGGARDPSPAASEGDAT